MSASTSLPAGQARQGRRVIPARLLAALRAGMRRLRRAGGDTPGPDLAQLRGTLATIVERDAGWRDAIALQRHLDQLGGIAGKAQERLSRAEALEARLAGLEDGRASMPTFCTLTTAHLSTVIGQTEGAAYKIMEQLQTIDDLVTKTCEHVTSSDRQSAALIERAQTLVGRNAELITALDAYMRDRAAAAEAGRRRFELVMREAEALEQSFTDISRIVSMTKMVAINTGIEAAHAGEAGKGFAVVAKEVHSLSRETEAAMDMIRDGTIRVRAAISTHLNDGAPDGRVAEERDLLEQLGRQLAGLGADYTEIASYQRRVLEEIDGLGREISGSMMNALGAIQFQDIVRQQLEGVIASLDSLKTRGAAGTLATMNEDYRTEIQHDLHAEIAGEFTTSEDDMRAAMEQKIFDFR
jgi:methyl-accepting chemotaxis protein